MYIIARICSFVYFVQIFTWGPNIKRRDCLSIRHQHVRPRALSIFWLGMLYFFRSAVQLLLFYAFVRLIIIFFFFGWRPFGPSVNQSIYNNIFSRLLVLLVLVPNISPACAQVLLIINLTLTYANAYREPVQTTIP